MNARLATKISGVIVPMVTQYHERRTSYRHYKLRTEERLGDYALFIRAVAPCIHVNGIGGRGEGHQGTHREINSISRWVSPSKLHLPRMFERKTTPLKLPRKVKKPTGKTSRRKDPPPHTPLSSPHWQTKSHALYHHSITQKNTQNTVLFHKTEGMEING